MPRIHNHDKESHILTAYALRFDGYKFSEETGFGKGDTLEKAHEHFYATGTWAITPEAQLTAFFMLQRYLMKWGGERENPRGNLWRAFRSLFLTTCEYVIAPAYHHGEYYTQWKARYQPDHAEHVALIRHIHETLDYDDNAPLRG